MVDHFNYDTVSAAENHDVLLVNRPTPSRSDVVDFFGGQGIVAFPNAVGQTLGNNNPLLTPLLKAPATAYAYNPKDATESVEDVFATGSQLALASAMQARNSARFVVLGSLESLQDKWYGASVKAPGSGKTIKTVNQEFAKQVTEWVFKEVGVLKVVSVNHHEISPSTKPGENTTQLGLLNPGIYRIKNDVVRRTGTVTLPLFRRRDANPVPLQKYTIELSQWSHTHWTPFVPPATDSVQLEFSMLSPFHRLGLTATSASANSTIFSTTFTTPDQHGIFAFKVNYKRPWLTNIEEKVQVTVRHFAHDEWPRSWAISGAWPWIAGLWSVIVGFLAFVVLWLYAEPPKEDGQRRRKLSISTAK